MSVIIIIIIITIIIRRRTRRIRVIFIRGAHSPLRFSDGALSVGHESGQDSVTVLNIVRNYGEAFSTF